MHDSVRQWVKEKASEYNLREGMSVLEVGSRDYNGTVREFFRNGWYVGIDCEAGDAVDIVCDAKDLAGHFELESFDVVVSTEMLEHDPRPWLSLPVMASMIRPDGLMILTTRGAGFHYHEYPGDYWRYTRDSMQMLLEEECEMEVLELTQDPQSGHPGVFAVARKSGG